MVWCEKDIYKEMCEEIVFESVEDGASYGKVVCSVPRKSMCILNRLSTFQMHEYNVNVKEAYAVRFIYWSFVNLKRSVGLFPRAARICSEMIKSTEFVLHESLKVSTYCPVVKEA